MRYIFSILLLVPFLLHSQMKDEFLEPPRKSDLILNTLVMHEHSSSFKSGFRPLNGVESLGPKGIGKVSLFTSYISASPSDGGEHIQRIELYSPDKKKLIYKSGKKFNVKLADFSKGKFLRGYLDHTIVFPPLSHADKNNFGLYVISIYLDDVWMKDFIVPIFAK